MMSQAHNRPLSFLWGLMNPITLVLVALGVTGIVAQDLRAAPSILVENVTTGTVIFNDDGFEDDAVGSLPNQPVVGTWATNIPGGDIVDVLNDAAPGAATGLNYLRITRPPGAPGGVRADAVFASAVATGETLRATFSFQYASTGTSGARSSVAIVLMDGGATRVNMFAEPDWGAAYYYTFNAAYTKQVDSALAVAPGQWQKITLEYTAGSDDLILTVDGVSQTLAGALAGSAGTVDRIRFNTASANTLFYLDAQAVRGSDTCDGAKLIPLAPIGFTTVTGTTEGLARDGTSTCDPPSPELPDIWYQFVASGSGTLSIDTTGTDPLVHVVLAMYTGDCDTLTEVACKDMCNGGTPCSSLSVPVTQGARYFLRVAANGAFTLNIGGMPPPNDVCGNAKPIELGTITGTTNYAASDGAGSCGTPGSPDVWYSWTASFNGTISLNTCGSASDTVLTVYQGACEALTEIACNADCSAGNPCGSPAACLAGIPVTAGSTYLIRVSGIQGATGDFALTLSGVPAPVQLWYDFEGDPALGPATDKLVSDGKNDGAVFGAPPDASPVTVTTQDPADGLKSLLFVNGAIPGIITIPETADLGPQATLAVALRNVPSDGVNRRLFSTYNGGGTTPQELCLQFDSSGSMYSVGFPDDAIWFEYDGMWTRIPRSAISDWSSNVGDTATHHVAMTWDNGAVKIYFDGVQVGEDTHPTGGNFVFAPGPLFFGEDYLPSDQFTEQFLGTADDILVLRRALDAQEISKMHAQGTAAWASQYAPPADQASFPQPGEVLYTMENDSGTVITNTLSTSGAQNVVLPVAGITGSAIVADKPIFGMQSLLCGTGLAFNGVQMAGTRFLGPRVTLSVHLRDVPSGMRRVFSTYHGGAVDPGELAVTIDSAGLLGGTDDSIWLEYGGLWMRIPFTAVGDWSSESGDHNVHNLAFTWDQGAIKAYFDGREVGSETYAPGGRLDFGEELRFGEDYPTTGTANEPLIGMADDILILDYVLSPQQIRQLSLYGVDGFLHGVATPDLDADGDVDMDDVILFAGCYSGPMLPIADPASCGSADLDKDNDIDQSDFGLLQRCFSGRGVAMDPKCLP